MCFLHSYAGWRRGKIGNGKIAIYWNRFLILLPFHLITSAITCAVTSWHIIYTPAHRQTKGSCWPSKCGEYAPVQEKWISIKAVDVCLQLFHTLRRFITSFFTPSFPGQKSYDERRWHKRHRKIKKSSQEWSDHFISVPMLYQQFRSL